MNSPVTALRQPKGNSPEDGLVPEPEPGAPRSAGFSAAPLSPTPFHLIISKAPLVDLGWLDGL